MNKFVVAIHGIGNQRRAETIRQVAMRFGYVSEQDIPVEPLGYFNLGGDDRVVVSKLLITLTGAPAPATIEVGFAEVYWADVPRTLSQRGDVLDESKAWARTVAGRAHQLYLDNVANRSLRDAHFGRAAGVIEELVEGVGVLQNLLFIVHKAGLLNFELGPVLSDYVGGVQLVADFRFYRDDIIGRFHKVMTEVLRQSQRWCAREDVSIYVVAHSEGTVVSFAAMLEALLLPAARGRTHAPPHIETEWIEYVRGYMTFGSPIDKHILLWPELWADIGLPTYPGGLLALQGNSQPQRAAFRQLQNPIEWRNYYDFGDPIGFELDTARAFLQFHQCKAFNFNATNDRGFSRYPLPGVAHTQYWDDPAVFGDFIYDVVLTNPQPARACPPLKTKPAVVFVSWTLPYLLVLLLNICAVGVTFELLAQRVDLISGMRAVPFCGSDGCPAFLVDLIRSAVVVGSFALLLTGATVLSRVQRLARRTDLVRWLMSFAALAICVASGNALHQFVLAGSGFAEPDCFYPAVVSFVVIAFIAGCLPSAKRWGRRLLLATGALFSLAVICTALYELSLPPAKSVWPVLVGWLASMYLWWIAIVVFDLTYTWHWYIRKSGMLRKMRLWVKGRDA